MNFYVAIKFYILYGLILLFDLRNLFLRFYLGVQKQCNMFQKFIYAKIENFTCSLSLQMLINVSTEVSLIIIKE